MNNLETLSEIKAEIRSSAKGVDVQWKVAPPLNLIWYSIFFNALSEKDEYRYCEFIFLLQHYTNQSFKTAKGWQSWYRKNKDRIYWDDEARKYVVGE